MLVRLEIKDIAVISHAVFEPETGLNVITGETGAGKSLLIDAIGLILGDKASKLLIRNGSDEAYVEAVFDIGDGIDDELADILESSGLSCDDGQLIISRRITRDGKSIARINGRTVILALLREVGSFLVDIHGQQDTQRIFNEKYHVDILDSFGGQEMTGLLSSYRELLDQYKAIILEIRNLSASPESLSKRREYLELAITEIEEAGFVEGEEERLIEQKHKNDRRSKSLAALTDILNTFDSEDERGRSTLSGMRNALDEAERIKDSDPEYSDIAQEMEAVYYRAEAVADKIRKIIENDGYDAQAAADVVERLGLLYDLKSKYGDTVSKINEFASMASEEIKGMADVSTRLIRLKKDRFVFEAKLKDAANALSDKRHLTAEIMSARITEELRELEIPSAVFKVEFCQRSKERYFTSYGTEDIRFMFSANPGEPARPLSSIVSGGEASRIMLAVKTILSEADKMPTMIFDEIDTGVSGVASVKIAERLHTISLSHQVLCVTHTAQVTAAANNNYFISKEVLDGSTESTVRKLAAADRVNEVSRLLSGDSSEESVKLAEKLIASFR